MAREFTVKEAAMDVVYLLIIAALYLATHGLARAFARLGSVE